MDADIYTHCSFVMLPDMLLSSTRRRQLNAQYLQRPQLEVEQGPQLFGCARQRGPKLFGCARQPKHFTADSSTRNICKGPNLKWSRGQSSSDVRDSGGRSSSDVRGGRSTSRQPKLFGYVRQRFESVGLDVALLTVHCATCLNHCFTLLLSPHHVVTNGRSHHLYVQYIIF